MPTPTLGEKNQQLSSSVSFFLSVQAGSEALLLCAPPPPLAASAAEAILAEKTLGCHGTKWINGSNLEVRDGILRLFYASNHHTKKSHQKIQVNFFRRKQINIFIFVLLFLAALPLRTCASTRENKLLRMGGAEMVKLFDCYVLVENNSVYFTQTSFPYYLPSLISIIWLRICHIFQTFQYDVIVFEGDFCFFCFLSLLARCFQVN